MDRTAPDLSRGNEDWDILNEMAFALSNCDLATLEKVEIALAEMEPPPEKMAAATNLIQSLRDAIEAWQKLQPKEGGGVDLQALRQQDAKAGSPVCRKCGCTNNFACVDENGVACFWAEEDPPLCSACVGESLIILPFSV